jgi:hypothetical protein
MRCDDRDKLPASLVRGPDEGPDYKDLPDAWEHRCTASAPTFAQLEEAWACRAGLVGRACSAKSTRRQGDGAHKVGPGKVTSFRDRSDMRRRRRRIRQRHPWHGGTDGHGSPTDIFFTRDGYTTAGAAIAMLVALSLVFTSVWTVRAESRASSVQAVADAAALAAENEVAEFVVAVRVADATLLTMTLTGLTLEGIGVVCCCVPGLEGLGDGLINAGEDVLKKRAEVARTQETTLNAMQDGLCVAAQAQAQAVIMENNTDQTTFAGVVELEPQEGSPVTIPALDKTERASEKVKDSAEDIKEAARTAEEATKKAEQARNEGYYYDCGASPDGCLYERAGALAGLSGTDNPYYHSVATWSFDVPLQRARTYYRHRLATEAPASDAVEEQARSALRRVFYAYAIEELDKGHVVDDGVTAPDIYLPKLPKNTQEMKATRLYTEVVFPVSAGEHPYIHAWSGCPQLAADGMARQAPLSELDGGGCVECPVCHFTTASLGKVGAASSSIDNGFEYYYRKIADAAESYTEARGEAAPALQRGRGLVDDVFDAIGEALQQAAGWRIQAEPPGRNGAVAVVTMHATDQGVPFVNASSDLGMFGAVSASVLVDDANENVVSQLLDDVAVEGAGAGQAGQWAVRVWGTMLDAYANGVDGVSSGVKELLDGLPLAGACGLGDWASDKLVETIDDAGLAPADTAAAKPVLVNSSPVVEKGTGPVAQAVKEGRAFAT